MTEAGRERLRALVVEAMAPVLARRPSELRALGLKRCTRCGEHKPRSEFGQNAGRPRSMCPPCLAAYQAERDRRPDRRARVAAYVRRPEVRERRRENNRRWAEANAEWCAAYRQSLLARTLHARRCLRARLKQATDPDRQSRLRDQIAAHDREIERLRKQMDNP